MNDSVIPTVSRDEWRRAEFRHLCTAFPSTHGGLQDICRLTVNLPGRSERVPAH
jgi:hypothetical protein